MQRNSIIKTASIIGVAGNAVLAGLKIVIGLMAGSLSVFGDGLDSLMDIFVSLITLIISYVILRPPDREHPYGHFRAETIATAILAFIIFFVGGQLSLSTLDMLLNHHVNPIPDMLAVYVTIISIVGKVLLAWSQYALGKKSGSPMILANGKNMLNDIITSLGVLIGLIFVFLYKTAIIDMVLAIIIGVWIMFTAVRIFLGTVTEIMEGEADMDMYNRIFEEVKKSHGVCNPHRVRIRKIGYQYIVDMDVEVDGNSRVKDAHEKIADLEKRICSSIPNIYDVVIHIEPEGNYEYREKWGLNEKELG